VVGQIIVKCIEGAILLFIALISDVKSYKIKNKVTVTFMALGLITNFCYAKYKGLIGSLLGVVVPLVLLIILYALRMLGAGDIKLFCALGAIFGVEHIIEIMAYSFLAGGVIAFFFMLMRRNAKERFRHLFNYFKAVFLTFSFMEYTEFEDKKDKGKFRFAYAVFAGTFFFIIKTLFF
jgi:prepilin peptidase CpaA